MGPVDGLGHARLLEEVRLAQFMNKRNDLPTQCFRSAGSLFAKDFQFSFGIRVIDPVIKTAPLESVVDFTGPVGGDDDDWRLFRLEETDLRDGYLII